ncbi:MAG TPA: glycosyltransferase family 4 protein [Chloroflexia bacterium]|nr:glycosyltransferase family 4 protein [Chloroflexia bacterium]
MKILYIAGSVVAPGSHGGATHVMEVASELSKLGHELHVVCRRNRREASRLTIPVEGGQPIQMYRLRLSQYLNLISYPWISMLARAIRPDLIMERYYNMAGAGMLYAHRHQLPSILEVNALMVDPPGTRKHKVDQKLGRRLEGWATKQCRWAGRIVTPLHTTVPASIDRAKIAELPWGANVERFSPEQVQEADKQRLRQELVLPSPQNGARVAVFAGSFRHWHGVETLVEAARLLIPRDEQLYFLLLGGGPEEASLREKVKAAGLEKRIILTGAIQHEKMPLYLSLGDCGVAPFDTSKHAPLRAAGFFWSPLKIFEYMAMNLPTVTVDLKPLNEIVRPGLEGALFKEGDAADLARVLGEILAPGPEAAHKRATMGNSARQRVAECYSWKAHCASLDHLIKQLTGVSAQKDEARV